MDAETVTQTFNKFLIDYELFRKSNNLSGSLDNVHESISGMVDKLGRISRYVKHNERSDPKEDWPDGLTKEMSGLLVYMILILNHYNLNISKGMIDEFNGSIEQHRKE